MATHSLLYLVRTYWNAPADLTRVCPHPVLVWEPPRRQSDVIETTDVTGTPLSFERGEPVAIEVVKGATPNGFPFGVTIGHAENNDVILRHHQVSRFHAYIRETGGKRMLIDASSKNGTLLDGVSLSPSKPVPLPAVATLHFGMLEVVYVEPSALADWLARRLEKEGGTNP